MNIWLYEHLVLWHMLLVLQKLPCMMGIANNLMKVSSIWLKVLLTKTDDMYIQHHVNMEAVCTKHLLVIMSPCLAWSEPAEHSIDEWTMPHVDVHQALMSRGWCMQP